MICGIPLKLLKEQADDAINSSHPHSFTPAIFLSKQTFEQLAQRRTVLMLVAPSPFSQQLERHGS
ncbi:hypothetical protein [Anoxybacteroides rupiense]|uniref:hypothetical protein n=1 Tax=Anoxybacteroides rupiense TaxID=311460 RepID=UPI003FA5B885